jgi:Co/Zn/Cd efflux system component
MNDNTNIIDNRKNETRTKLVVLITAVTMVLEIFFGYWTNSMALLADGWHMATHVFALALTWLAYFVTRKYSNTEKYTFDSKKILSLSGFINAFGKELVDFEKKQPEAS